MSDRDTRAIASWQAHDEGSDPGRQKRSESRNRPDHRYVCVLCEWRGSNIGAVEHYIATGHDVRGKSWPASFGNMKFPSYVQRARTA